MRARRRYAASEIRFSLLAVIKDRRCSAREELAVVEAQLTDAVQRHVVRWAVQVPATAWRVPACSDDVFYGETGGGGGGRTARSGGFECSL